MQGVEFPYYYPVESLLCSHFLKAGVVALVKGNGALQPLGCALGLGADENHKEEGRVVTVEYAAFIICAVYSPNSGEGLKRLDYRARLPSRSSHPRMNPQRSLPAMYTRRRPARPRCGLACTPTHRLPRVVAQINTWEPALRESLRALDARKPVMLVGDLNVAHLDADIYNVTAKHIPKSAGTTPEERAAFGELLSSCGLVARSCPVRLLQSSATRV